MFLVIGSSTIAVNLANWCSERRPTRLIGLASLLDISEDLGDCEILPLPKALSVSELPDTGQKPTAVILVDSDVLDEEETLTSLRERWPEAPILPKKTAPQEIDKVDEIDTQDIITAAFKEKCDHGKGMLEQPCSNHISATFLKTRRLQYFVTTILIQMLYHLHLQCMKS